jgi:hypothetical protein
MPPPTAAGLFGGRHDKVEGPHEGEPVSRESGRPTHRSKLRGTPTAASWRVSARRKAAVTKFEGGAAWKRVARCVRENPGEEKSPGEQRARRPVKNRPAAYRTRRWSKAVKAGRTSGPEARRDGEPRVPWRTRGTVEQETGCREEAVNDKTARAAGRRDGCRRGARLWRAKPQEREPDETSRQGTQRSEAVRRVRNPGGGP